MSEPPFNNKKRRGKKQGTKSNKKSKTDDEDDDTTPLEVVDDEEELPPDIAAAAVAALEETLDQTEHDEADEASSKVLSVSNDDAPSEEKKEGDAVNKEKKDDEDDDDEHGATEPSPESTNDNAEGESNDIAADKTEEDAKEEPNANAEEAVNAIMTAADLSSAEALSSGTSRRLSVTNKWDEKWNEMFDKLKAFKEEKGHCNVHQNYKADVKLGRWTHYQRVEYWFLKRQGSAKITQERIDRLEAIGFKWDPQKDHWDTMFDRLCKFKDTHGHCQVSKNYQEDKILANWVRNQRLEMANKKRGQKSRMDDDRKEKLESLGFIWSKPTAVRGPKKKKEKAEDAQAGTEEDQVVKEEETAVKNEDSPKEGEEKAPAGSDEAIEADTKEEPEEAPDHVTEI